ncbi:PIGR protein, partial [Galbula dea]|nr:PIGR protein [Galbula dea]
PVSSTLYGPRFLRGEVGGSVTHQCFYSTTAANRHDRKYWCRVTGTGVCSTIISTTGYTSRDHQGRVSLKDIPQNGTFLVTMTELKSSDTGTYRCGIGTTNRDLYVSLSLVVSADAGGLGPIELVWGELRGSVTVLCSSRATRGGKKRSWCKVGRSSCALIADTDGYVAKGYQGRISLSPQESSGAFKVLINDLKKEDSGLYRCGTGRLSSQDSSQMVALQMTTASSLPRRPKFLSGTAGGSLSLKCHYDPQGSYEHKYLCRWQAGSCELLLDVAGFVHESYRGRMQIASSHQENGTFTVVMSHLRQEDAGWYWCGARKGQTEHTSSVKLLIEKETCTSQDPKTSTLVKSTSSRAATSSMSMKTTSSSPATSSIPMKPASTAATSSMSMKPTSSSPATSSVHPAAESKANLMLVVSLSSSSGESPLLPAVLPALILLIFITIILLILTKLKLQKGTGK